MKEFYSPPLSAEVLTMCLLFIIHSNQAMKVTAALTLCLIIDAILAHEYVLWFGFSQTGKSSCIHLLTQDDSIERGESGVGMSTTQTFTLYDELKPLLGRPYRHIDSVGMGDNNFAMSDEEIMNATEQLILKTYNGKTAGSIKAIIITETYPSQTVQLPLVLAKLKSIFGSIPTESIIVALTKRNVVETNNRRLAQRRREQVEKEAQKFGIPKESLVDFLTPSEDWGVEESTIPAEQFKVLGQAIERSKPLRSELIQYKYARILEIAHEVQKEWTEVKKVLVEVEREYKVPREERQTVRRTVPTVKWFLVIPYTSTESYLDTITVTVYDTVIKMEKEYHDTVVVPELEHCYGEAVYRYQKQISQEMRAKEVKEL